MFLSLSKQEELEKKKIKTQFIFNFKNYFLMFAIINRCCAQYIIFVCVKPISAMSQKHIFPTYSNPHQMNMRQPFLSPGPLHAGLHALILMNEEPNESAFLCTL